MIHPRPIRRYRPWPQTSVLLPHHNLIHPLLLARDLHSRGYRVEACAGRPHSVLHQSRHISAFHVVPSVAHPERLAGAICHLARTRHIGMFLPGPDQVFAFAPYRDQLASAARYPFEDAPTLARVRNKLFLQTALLAAAPHNRIQLKWNAPDTHLAPFPAYHMEHPWNPTPRTPDSSLTP